MRDTWPEPWNLIATDLLFIYELFVTSFDDIVTLTVAVWRFGLHWDPYNISLIAGKIIKIVCQYSYYTFVGYSPVTFMPFD